jgi:two-component system chemotaxis response regulator CheY
LAADFLLRLLRTDRGSSAVAFLGVYHTMDFKMKVLVVDDFSTMRRIVKNTLRQIGFVTIEEAEDGQKAYDRLVSEKFDFVVSDWNMPNMTGIDLLRKVRATPSIKSIPFLMVTAEAKQENVVEAIKAGVSNYIVKPFTVGTLQEKVAKIFKE